MQSLFLLLFACTLTFAAHASHIFGGELTYKYLGTFAPNTARYEVTLTLYEDCLYGLPEAIAQDDPEFINFFDQAGHPLFVDPSSSYPVYDSIMLKLRTTLINSSKDVCNLPFPFTDLGPKVCLQKAVFTKSYDLPVLATPGAAYTVVVQRCCLNGGIINIMLPASTGMTFSATIPTNSITNNSAIFKNDPFYYTIINGPINYSAAATDADGDSLSYEFCTAYKGGSNNDAKPIPAAPPFTPVDYSMPFSYSHPVTGSPTIQIDPNTGIISGTPTVTGRYLVVICCHEWRNGVNINTISREIQVVVTDCIHNRSVGLPSVNAVREKLNVYVNSSASLANISFLEGAGNILVTDMYGKAVYRSDLNNKQDKVEISTANWNKGLYIVRLAYPGIGTVCEKFVVD